MKIKSESNRSWFERQPILSMEKYILKKIGRGEDIAEMIEEVNENLNRGQFLGVERSYTNPLEIFFKEKVQDSREIIFWWNEFFFHVNLLPGTRADKKNNYRNKESVLFMIERIPPAQEPLFTYVLLEFTPDLQWYIIDTYERYTDKKIRFKLSNRLKFKYWGAVERKSGKKVYEAMNESLQLRRIPEITYRFRLNNSKEKMNWAQEELNVRNESFEKKYPSIFDEGKLPYKDLLHYISYLEADFRDALLLRYAGYFIKEIMDVQYREGNLKNRKITTVHSRIMAAKRKLEEILLREGFFVGCDE